MRKLTCVLDFAVLIILFYYAILMSCTYVDVSTLTTVGARVLKPNEVSLKTYADGKRYIISYQKM